MSAESSAGLIEMAFTYAIAIGIGVWQVVKMRREIARDRQAKQHQKEAEGTHTETNKT